MLGGAIDFQGSASDTDGTIATHTWNYGDGNGAAVEDPGSYTYQSTGVYTVTYTVTDDDGDPSIAATRAVTVANPGNNPPTATIDNPGQDTTIILGDAVEGEDYDLDRLIWLWDVTSIADKRIIDHNQQGVNSRFYKPGPYQEMESAIQEFSEWYLSELKGDT